MAIRSDAFVRPPRGVGRAETPIRDERGGGRGPGIPDEPGIGRTYRRLTPEMFGATSWDQLVPVTVNAAQREEIFKWLDGLETALEGGRIQMFGDQWRQTLSDWNRTFHARYDSVLQSPFVPPPAPDVPIPGERKGDGTVLDPRDEVPGQPGGPIPIDPNVPPAPPVPPPQPQLFFNAGGQLVSNVEGQGLQGVTFRQDRVNVNPGAPRPRFVNQYNPYAWYNNQWNRVQGEGLGGVTEPTLGRTSGIYSGTGNLFGQFHQFQRDGVDDGFSFYRGGTAPSPFVRPPRRPPKPSRTQGGGVAT